MKSSGSIEMSLLQLGDALLELLLDESKLFPSLPSRGLRGDCTPLRCKSIIWILQKLIAINPWIKVEHNKITANDAIIFRLIA